jgi:general secretion pathway protein D
MPVKAYYSSLAQREMIRRQNDVIEGDRLLAEGSRGLCQGRFPAGGGQIQARLSTGARTRRCSMTAAKATPSISPTPASPSPCSTARWANTPKPAPCSKRARRGSQQRLLPSANSATSTIPIRTNPALTYEHTQNVDKVRRTLYTAEGNFNLGKFDDAKREYENVLRIDPYNSAARRGMERLAAAKSDYYRAAYDHTRAELLSQVDAAWELTVPADLPSSRLEPAPGPAMTGWCGLHHRETPPHHHPAHRFRRHHRRGGHRLPPPAFRRARHPRTRSRPQGSQLRDRRPRAGGAGGGSMPVSMRRWWEALPLPVAIPARSASANSASATCRSPWPSNTSVMQPNSATRWTTSPSPWSRKPRPVRTSSPAPSPCRRISPPRSIAVAAAVAAVSRSLRRSSAAVPRLKPASRSSTCSRNAGIAFGEGTSATLSTNGVLLVTNTPTELDKVEQLVNAFINQQPKQVKITTKFVEISQENGEELGFDWIIGPFGVSTPTTSSGRWHHRQWHSPQRQRTSPARSFPESRAATNKSPTSHRRQPQW